jgi:hypothetical protein
MVAEGRVTKLQAAYTSPQDLGRLASGALLPGDAHSEGVSPLQRVARGLRLVRRSPDRQNAGNASGRLLQGGLG